MHRCCSLGSGRHFFIKVENKLGPPPRRPHSCAAASKDDHGTCPRLASSRATGRTDVPACCEIIPARAARGRHRLGPTATVAIVHRDGHLDELAGEGERALVVRDRRSAIASDVEAVPEDEVEEAELRLDAASRYADMPSISNVNAVVQVCARRHMRTPRRRLPGRTNANDRTITRSPPMFMSCTNRLSRGYSL
jgi:hypothetical protein